MTHSTLYKARRLRKESTDAENLLWHHLRMKQLYGYRFRRQHPVDHFIVDFVCLEKRLIIELDGGHHAEHKAQQYDFKRQEYLHAQGFKVLRFWNNEVFENMDGVLELIMEGLLDPPPAAPPARGGD